jgi:protein-S-isoprenylcysteine O-methyltransferase Ste14
MGNEIGHARVIPAPLIFLALAILGIVLEQIFPARFLPPSVAGIIAGVLVAMWLIVGGSALVAMLRAHTSPNPHRPAAALVESGVFRYSRNPMYLSLFLLYLGVASLANDAWLLLLFPILVLLTDRLVVLREEEYLASRFGDAYLRYKERVNRWL